MNTNNTPIKLFLTGATGYIGGSFLTKLLQSADKDKYEITVLIRSEAAAPKFKELGIKTLVGSIENSELLTQAALDADVVVNYVDCNNLPAVQALVKGLNTKDGKRRIFIHTSGAGSLKDEARGNYVSEKIYSDLDVDAINALPLTQPCRTVDSYILENNQNYDSLIVCPPWVYGLGSGLFNRFTMIIPILTKVFIQRGKGGIVGKGLNIWNHVHIDDIANFYVLLLEKALKGEASTGKDGIYFCESGEHTTKDAFEKIAEALYQLKLVGEPGVSEFTKEDIDTYFGGDFFASIFGGNSRPRADRARQLGWKPKENQITLFDSLLEEVKTFVEKEGLDKKN